MRQAEPLQAVGGRPLSNRSFPALLLVLFLILSAASCGGSSCIIAVWNFNGTISTGNGSCSLTTTPNGKTAVRLTAAEMPAGVPMAPNFQHVYVTLRGIEASPGANTADENSGDWEQLAPELAREPLQVDLIAAGAPACQRAPAWRATIPANQYRQLRLELAAEAQGAESSVPATNRCGGAGIHCVVTPSGEVRRVVFGSNVSELRIPATQIAEGGFAVLPDMETSLAIEFQPFASTAAPAGAAVRIAPIFSVNRAGSCDSSLATFK